MKARRVNDVAGRFYAVSFKCPGCKMDHTLPTQETASDMATARWHFNGDYERPTFSPSINAHGALNFDEPDERKDWMPDAICHSFVTDGHIRFLDDCTHSLRGHTVEIPDIE